MLHVLAQQAEGELEAGLTAIGRGVVYGGAAIGPGIGMVRTTMFLGIAFTEALALFGFVLSFIISG